ncbi:hypothetical protein GCM10025789_06230 [Tessaracoccus lubricantis]|uniref:Uncharacterized protein n=2 Tax=Tessaracoccus lubricantis TaxID=545543 RepID=A0ABP9F3Q4_9ACTN
MLLIGLLAGIALAAAAGVFLLGIGWATPLDAQSVISASPTPSASPTVSGAPAGAGDVSEACVRAAEYNVEVDQAVEELARGAEAQDARALQEALDRLQQARDDAAGASEECLAQAGQTPSTEEPSPSESPSQEPTPVESASDEPTSEEPSPSPSETP